MSRKTWTDEEIRKRTDEINYRGIDVPHCGNCRYLDKEGFSFCTNRKCWAGDIELVPIPSVDGVCNFWKKQRKE